MTVQLRTNDNQILKLSNIKKDSLNLEVRKGSFSGSTTMSHYVTNWTQQFIDDLNEMIANNINTTELEDEEGNNIILEVDKLGHVFVTGSIHDDSFPNMQELKFSLNTDQTCLKPFANDLSKALDESRS